MLAGNRKLTMELLNQGQIITTFVENAKSNKVGLAGYMSERLHSSQMSSTNWVFIFLFVMPFLLTLWLLHIDYLYKEQRFSSRLHSMINLTIHGTHQQTAQ